MSDEFSNDLAVEKRDERHRDDCCECCGNSPASRQWGWVLCDECAHDMDSFRKDGAL